MTVTPDADTFSRTRWVDWTPSYTNLTVGNGTVTARFVQLGDLVVAHWSFNLGTTSTVGTTPRIAGPVTPNSNYGTGGTGIIGVARFVDSGTTTHDGAVTVSTASDLVAQVQNVAGTYAVPTNISATVPFTWTNGDSMALTVIYEIA